MNTLNQVIKYLGDKKSTIFFSFATKVNNSVPNINLVELSNSSTMLEGFNLPKFNVILSKPQYENEKVRIIMDHYLKKYNKAWEELANT
jgi:hypothetical protein